MTHARAAIVEYFLHELALIHDEARALVDSPAKDLEVQRTAKPPWGQIYERYAGLLLLISTHFPDVPRGEWDKPVASDALFRPDLRLLQANASLLTGGLSALLSN